MKLRVLRKLCGAADAAPGPAPDTGRGQYISDTVPGSGCALSGTVSGRLSGREMEKYGKYTPPALHAAAGRPWSLTRRAARAAALFALLILFTLCVPRKAAASAYDDALQKLSAWGILNGYSDGQLHPERYLTRAQFVAMVNRAYGYSKVGKHPFKDVTESDWFYDDIATAYNMGYFKGTTKNTASPNNELTREQALTLLAINLRLPESTGENLYFTDSNQFHNYSKIYVPAALGKDLISGYEDGSFRPMSPITRGAMAVLLSRALGTLIQDEGTYELDYVNGNVTISSPNTTLKNTTIVGDLYITGGLGLAGTTLENVRVLGDIIVAGTGESETGDDSVVLRNVEADRLNVDSIEGQYLSLRSEGTTSIPETTVRTDAFIQDRTPSGAGLKNITLAGPDKNRFTLTGNVENVTNRSPNASLQVASGTVQSLTMDEEGLGASLNVDGNATVKTLNLDTATSVTGGGGVDAIHINTPGSKVSMLPDQIDIRPGINATVGGNAMDTTLGREASEDPRLLAGYPRVTDVAPNSATAVFSTNKSGTVYWAVSGVPDGSVEEEQLLSPLPYGSKALRSGNLRVTASNTELPVTINGLTTGGNYYLSAIMTDARGTRSPIKVVSFSTPDGTVPAFASGYPAVSNNSFDRNSTANDRYNSQISVMSNKSCQLYWALYNKNSAQPSPQDFRSGSLAGSLKTGVQELTRSFPSFVQLTGLLETTTYDIYLWLTDADFARSSSVKKLTFTTVDGTPPKFVNLPSMVSNRTTSITLSTAVNENATVYWAAVRAGTPYPIANRGATVVSPESARAQIMNGTNALKNGSFNVRANIPANFTISGLTAQTAYDIWYIARDTAGNFSDYPTGDLNDPNDPNNPRNVCMITENTVDTFAPTVKQEFTRAPQETPGTPYADTGIRLVFNEGIQRSSTSEVFLALYQDVTGAKTADSRFEAREALAECLRRTIELRVHNGSLDNPVQERDRANETTIENWTIDYRNAVILQEDTNLIVYFPTVSELDGTRNSALRLSSGTWYHFEIHDIADVSKGRNRMPDPTRLDRFRTISAQVALNTLSLPANSYPNQIRRSAKEVDRVVDMAFTMIPISTSMADPNTTWDMLIWSDISCEFEMYVRSRLSTASSYDVDLASDIYPTDALGWRKVERPMIGEDGDLIHLGGVGKVVSNQRANVGQSLHYHLYHYGVGETPLLTELDDERIYEYAIRFLKINEDDDRTGWSQEVHFHISVLEGSSSALDNLSSNITEERFQEAQKDATAPVTEISTPNNLGFQLTRAFRDTIAPLFSSGRPTFTPGDISVDMRLQITRQGTVFYAIAPADGTITTRDLERRVVDWDSRHREIPTHGYETKLDDAGNEVTGEDGKPIYLAPFYLTAPSYLEIVNPEFDNSDIKVGSQAITSGSVNVTVKGLMPETNYFVYFVIRGTGQVYSQYVSLYRFTTTEVMRPILTLDLANPIVNVSTNRESEVDFMIARYDSAALSTLLSRDFWNHDPSGMQSPPEGYGAYKGISNVLQAMATNLASADDGGRGSVFDKYATQDYKDQLAEYIRASSSNTAGTIIGVGHGITVSPGRRHVVNCSEYPMSERAQYAFFAVGRSAAGSGDAFRAIYPITLVDSEAPKVTAVQSTLNMDTVTLPDGTQKVLETCSGRVSLTFNEYLCYSDDTTAPPTLRQVDLGSIVDARRQQGEEFEKFISVGALIQSVSNEGEVGLMLKSNEVGRQTLTVDFDFQSAQNGAFITFNSDLCDQYSNVRKEPLSVSIEIVKVKTQVDVDAAGEPIYGFIATPLVNITPEWDTRAK